MGRGLVYTANFGNYDTPKPIRLRESGVDYVCFTGQGVPPKIGDPRPPATIGDWLHRQAVRSSSNRRSARAVKVWTPIEEEGYDWFLWVDATMEIVGPVREFVETALKEHDFAAWRHPWWQCSYVEIDKCIAMRKDRKDRLEKGRKLLQKAKFPKNYGQLATWVLLRKNTDLVKKHAEAWWRDMGATTMRDQVTFMLNLWRLGAQIQWLPKTIDHAPWVKFHRGHAQPPRKW